MNIVNCSHADAPLMNIVNCSQQRPSWISPIIPRCVLHEHCLRMNPTWISSTVCKSSASGILPGPAPCTPRMRPASYMEVSLGASVFFILHQLLAAWMDASCIDTAARPWLELPWFIVLHVEVIYFSMQPKVRKLLGVLYREYYQYTVPQTLLQLYISLVCPHLEDASLSMESQLAKK